MKRVVTFLTSVILIISLAAPAGAVFASEATGVKPVVDSVIISEQSLLKEAEQTEETAETGSNSKAIITEIPLIPEVFDLPEEDQTILSEDTVVSSKARSVVITELQTRGSGGASAELVELYNASDQEVDVTGWCLQRASATGVNYITMTCIKASDAAISTRVILPPHSYVVLVSELTATINPTLRYDLIFAAGMADTGGRMRVVNAAGQTIDLVGWGNANEHEGVAPALAVPVNQPLRSLQRVAGDSGEYQNTPDNSLDFTILPARVYFESGSLYEVVDLCINIPGIQEFVAEHLLRNRSGDCVERSNINFCEAIRVNEIAANMTRQYIELANGADHDASLAGCRIMTNRSSSIFLELPDITLAPHEYYVTYIDETSLLLSKSTTGTVYLLASDGETEVQSLTYEELLADTSWSYFTDGWKQTYELTPKIENIYAQFAACSAGQERHLETGRCRAISAEPVLLDCGEGRERNPVTNRCRNVVSTTPAVAGFAVEPVTDTVHVFTGWWVLGGIMTIALGYVGWEWRDEIKSFVRKSGSFFRSSK